VLRLKEAKKVIDDYKKKLNEAQDKELGVK
jgi:hypothetical protein